MDKSAIEVLASRHVLRLCSIDELKGAADSMLAAGHCTPALVDLFVTVGATIEEAGIQFRRALSELEIALPSRDEAVWILLRHYLRQIACERIPPREEMQHIITDVVHGAGLHEQSRHYLGDSHDMERLLGEYYAIDDIEERPGEVAHEEKQGTEAGGCRVQRTRATRKAVACDARTLSCRIHQSALLGDASRTGVRDDQTLA